MMKMAAISRLSRINKDISLKVDISLCSFIHSLTLHTPQHQHQRQMGQEVRYIFRRQPLEFDAVLNEHSEFV